MAENRPKLNFPTINLAARERDGKTMVWDAIRKMYVVLTPEEWVRRHAVEFLISHCNIPRINITEEYIVRLNSMTQRADIVAFDNDARPFILVECKAPEVKIDQSVIDQAIRYNHIVKARYIILTNGLKHYCIELTDEGYIQRQSFPTL